MPTKKIKYNDIDFLKGKLLLTHTKIKNDGFYFQISDEKNRDLCAINDDLCHLYLNLVTYYYNNINCNNVINKFLETHNIKLYTLLDKYISTINNFDLTYHLCIAFCKYFTNITYSKNIEILELYHNNVKNIHLLKKLRNIKIIDFAINTYIINQMNKLNKYKKIKNCKLCIITS